MTFFENLSTSSWIYRGIFGILGTALVASVSWGYGMGNRVAVAEEKIANISIWLERIEGKLDRVIRRTERQWGENGGR